MHKDATGRPIEKGSYVAYVVTTGSRAGIKFGRVTKLKETSKERSKYDTASQTYQPVTEIDYTIQIISVEKGWRTQNKWDIQGKREGRPAKVQSVERLDRVIILDPHQMHPEAKEILDKEMLERGA